MNKKLNNKKPFIHDRFFKEIFSHLKYALDLFRLIFTKAEFALFDWASLKSEATTFIDKKGLEKRTDLQFSVQTKDSKEQVTMVFLLEHKSYQDSKALLQMLGYQTGIYEQMAGHSHFKTQTEKLPPVLPILVNQSNKPWKGVLEFQEFLNWTPELKKQFGQNVLSFRPRFLNIPDLSLKKGAEGLTSYPALFILKHIWKLDRTKVERFFVLSQDISYEERRFLVEKVVSYIRKYDPSFSWSVLQEIEEETIEDKEDRVMTLFQETLEEARQEARKEARQEARKEWWQKGQQQGMQQGMQQGHATRHATGPTGSSSQFLVSRAGLRDCL